MIQIFDIKKRSKNMQVNDKELCADYNKISGLSSDELLGKYLSNKKGLSEKWASSRLARNGLNVVIKDDKKSWFYFLAMAFRDQFIIILLVLAIINMFLGDTLGSIIIIVIALISAFIRFFQDYSAYNFNLKLKGQIFSSAVVLRDGCEKSIRSENVVAGDIVKLNAGSIVPADLVILESKDLFLNQAVFTGESIPVEKTSVYKKSDDVFNISNICFMGCSVISGSATALVIKTGFDTYLGNMGKGLDVKREPTNFEIGMNKITKMLIRYMVIVCLFVLVINGLVKGNWNDAILFALSVAVGITPSMLPMIVNVNLTKGAKALAKKNTLVKKLDSIQNLGAIDILCTDKTGTLTEDNIVLQRYVNASGEDDLRVLRFGYLNSYFATGMKNLVDRAILSYASSNGIDGIKDKYVKIDEVPFDYNRRMLSVVTKCDDEVMVITKGALEEIFKICNSVYVGDSKVELSSDIKDRINLSSINLAKTGMQVIALAVKKCDSSLKLESDFECDMTFVGLMGFFDPPKKDAKKTIGDLRDIGVRTKVLTGDNYYAASSVCKVIGLNDSNILTGDDIDKMSDEKLVSHLDDTDVFARLNPLQKQRIVELYKKCGHVVGYMGDGVNDSPSLHVSDVGISVNTATDIAKESSDIILLKKSLRVVYDGVLEGRRVYGNIMKYMKMALSADFGDVFSIMIASLFLPFLPLLPIQMLIQDFIYDFSQIGIPYDNVDEEFLQKPRKWDTKNLSTFMNVMGITSSVIDVAAFVIFWFVLGYNSLDMQSYFQTAWFVMCLISELMIIHNVRTSKVPFVQSVASKPLICLTLLSMALTVVTPILLVNVSSFHFEILPIDCYCYILALVLVYALIVSVIKRWYIGKYKEWL